MDSREFVHFRKRLEKTQRDMALLLGVSIKAIHSYEQGWRSVPTHVERQVIFLVTSIKNGSKVVRPCWSVKKCPPERKKQCPAWEFRAGKLCWFINGTICQGKIQKSWKKKMQICRKCEVLRSQL